MANSTAGTISGYIWNLLREQGDTTDIPALQESFILTLISQANIEYLKAHRRGGGTAPIVLMRDGGFDLVADTALAVATTTETTDFTVDDSSSYDTTNGAFVIWDENLPDVGFYTTNDAATALSGVTDLDFAHEIDDVYQALYKLPTNFSHFIPTEGYGDGMRVNGRPLRFTKGIPRPGYFTYRGDGTNKFVWYIRGLTGSASFIYQKSSATIDSSDDVVDVEPDYEFFLVWRSVQMALIPKEGDVSNLYVQARDEANRLLLESLRDRNVGKHIRPRPFRIPDNRLYDASLNQHVPR